MRNGRHAQKAILDRFPALSRSLTTASKLAGEQLLNHDFESAFTDECEALRAPAVTLDFPGRRGQPARRKSLTTEHRLRTILSEGEQKVIALADFIAEATLRRSPTPIVLDDPVASLDYKRLAHVADRLVELSETRQVIVFTHNIWFTMELLALFDRDRTACTYYDVSGRDTERGVVSRGESPRLDTWSDKKTRINRLIERANNEEDSSMRDVFVEKGYDDMRGACEIIVENDLLQSVVQSYRPNVMIGNLLRVRFKDLPETRFPLTAQATAPQTSERITRRAPNQSGRAQREGPPPLRSSTSYGTTPLHTNPRLIRERLIAQANMPTEGTKTIPRRALTIRTRSCDRIALD